MTIERPKPLYNPEGQVNDPKIAREMADEENFLSNNPEKVLDKHKKENLQKSIDSQTSELGRMAQVIKEGDYLLKIEQGRNRENYEIETKKIAEKLIAALSFEELHLLKKYPKDILRHFTNKK